ncbi:MAG: aminopeptidase [Oscillospiraceae bacterium]|nr:aminopeptidase [Oscillospiraceae bacterium]
MAKSEVEKLKKQLFAARPHAGQALTPEQWRKIHEYSATYKNFLQNAKTEREAVELALELARGRNFTEYDPEKTYCAGEKVYVNNRKKALILAVIGKNPLDAGLRILASHVDSPRLDAKQNPLYEDSDLALFKTHYYGGIKKYQWTALPLALHGVIVRGDGQILPVSICEQEDEPQFCVTDLLPHLDREQSKRKLSQGIKGEELNVLVGSMPFRADEGSELVKLNILRLIFDKYGIVEEDFLSAELEFVPAVPVRDIGLDRSMIGGYGQDDRVCAYTSISAILALDHAPPHTAVALFADKEETGSDGNTGMQSAFFEHFVESLCEKSGVRPRDCFAASECLSADVNVAYDPTWSSVLEKNNAAYLNKGVVATKYTGSGGKFSTSDASAEFTAKIIALFRDNGLLWQTGELGKVDEGGGGTVAKYLAKLGMDVIDVGVPILSMHSPFEVSAKADVWMAYRAFGLFLTNDV